MTWTPESLARARQLVESEQARHPADAAAAARLNKTFEVEFPLTAGDAALFGLPAGGRMNTAWLAREAAAAAAQSGG